MSSSHDERPRRAGLAALAKGIRKTSCCVPPFGALSRPRNYVRFLSGEGSLRKRYADALTAHSLEVLVSRELGSPVECVGYRAIGENPKSERSYARYALRPLGTRPTSSLTGGKAEGEIHVFLKRGSAVGKFGLDKYLSGRCGGAFYIPRFYGRFRANGTNVAVWEFIAGAPVPFAPTHPEDAAKVVEGLAAVAALPYDEVVRTGVSIGISWFRPCAEQIESLVRDLHPEGPEKSELLQQTEDLAALEGRLLARFDAMGHRYLAHNDVNSGNLLRRAEDGRVVIVDWTSARLSVPGASLREVATWPESAREGIATIFVNQMRRAGHPYSLAEILLGADGTKMFNLLAGAVSRRDVRAARRGLELALRLSDQV